MIYVKAFTPDLQAERSDLIWIKAHVREAGHVYIDYLCDGAWL